MNDKQPTDEELAQLAMTYATDMHHADTEAAHYLEAMAARLRELSEQVESLQIRYDGMATGRRCERASLEADRDRYREALEEIEFIDLQWADGLDANVERIKTVARNALRM